MFSVNNVATREHSDVSYVTVYEKASSYKVYISCCTSLYSIYLVHLFTAAVVFSGSRINKHLGRPPVVLTDTGTGCLRNRARHWCDGGQRGVPASDSPRRARWPHVQGLPHSVRASERQTCLLRVSEVRHELLSMIVHAI